MLRVENPIDPLIDFLDLHLAKDGGIFQVLTQVFALNSVALIK